MLLGAREGLGEREQCSVDQRKGLGEGAMFIGPEGEIRRDSSER